MTEYEKLMKINEFVTEFKNIDNIIGDKIPKLPFVELVNHYLNKWDIKNNVFKVHTSNDDQINEIKSTIRNIKINILNEC